MRVFTNFSKNPNINFIQAENKEKTKDYNMSLASSSSGLCLSRATGNDLHVESCGNVLQTLEMKDGPVDASIFSLDSSSKTV